MTLKLTKKELESFVNNNLPERFEEIFNDIPMYHPEHVMEKDETHRDYCDDGREYRWFIFKDNLTGEEYILNYTYNSEWTNDIMDFPSSIELVTNKEESDLYVAPEPVVVSEPVLTPEAQADKELWSTYQAIKHECREVKPKERLKVPKSRIDEILNLLKTKNFNMYQLRGVVIPVCIDYKLEDVTFWRWIQSKAYK